MKKIIIIIILLINAAALNAQSFSVYDVDTTDFPLMKAKFYAFDEDANQILNLAPEDFELFEDGAVRKVLNVSCPEPEPPKALSSVLTIDISGSMRGQNLENAKAAARAWVEGLPLGKSECAITTFEENNFFNRDFTTDKDKLLNAIENLEADGGTDFNAGFINSMAGALLVAEKGKYKKVVVFITDGYAEGSETEIIQKAAQINATVYCVTLNMKSPQILKNVAVQSGGQWFENITTKAEAEDVYNMILNIARDCTPCEIEWESGISCAAGITNLELRIRNLGIEAATGYQSPDGLVAGLEIVPASIKILEPEPGVQKDTTIIVTAHNADFSITKITSTNAAFFVKPQSFILNDGQSKELTVSFIPPDSGYTFTRFDFVTDVCPEKYYASGGWRGKSPKQRTIKLLHPNGGEVFVAGSDTILTWEGVSPDEPVKLEYRTDDDQPWVIITDTATGLSHRFKVPGTASKKYLARVTAKTPLSSYCDNPDVQICDQVWMGCNLDVAFYRNGDPIRYCETNDEWKDANGKQEGAWCYYDNDPENGAIYGKLYNWYAISDPRGLAPEGWHVPTDEEWQEMEICLGMGQSTANETGYRGFGQGSILAGRADLWKDGSLENHPDFNSSGFSALPGGYRSDPGICYNLGDHGYWWTSTENQNSFTWRRILYYVQQSIYRGLTGQGNGFSVRLVQD